MSKRSCQRTRQLTIIAEIPAQKRMISHAVDTNLPGSLIFPASLSIGLESVPPFVYCCTLRSFVKSKNGRASLKGLSSRVVALILRWTERLPLDSSRTLLSFARLREVAACSVYVFGREWSWSKIDEQSHASIPSQFLCLVRSFFTTAQTLPFTGPMFRRDGCSLLRSFISQRLRSDLTE